MKKRPLSVYVVGVVIAIVIVNIIAWFTGGGDKLHTTMIFSLGFLLGMLAMYIAVHIYKWK